jgi:hypothetical protein
MSKKQLREEFEFFINPGEVGPTKSRGLSYSDFMQEFSRREEVEEKERKASKERKKHPRKSLVKSSKYLHVTEFERTPDGIPIMPEDWDDPEDAIYDHVLENEDDPTDME